MRLPQKSLLALSFAMLSVSPSAIASETPTLFGRFLFDYANLQGDNTNLEVDESELRALRFGAKGELVSDVKYKFSITFENSDDAILTDAYLEFSPEKFPANIRVGQFKTAISLDEETSSRVISTHERAAFTDAFEFGRRVGIALQDTSEKLTYSLGVYAQNIEAADTLGGYAVAGRVAYAPIVKDNFKVQIGSSFRYRSVDQDQPLLRARQRPVSHIPGRLLSTGRFADNDLFIGGELAIQKGSFWAAGEYAASFADCVACANDPVLTGGYVEAGFVLGGVREIKKGKFAAPTVSKSVLENGYGALTFVARYDSIDLSDGDINGGSYDAFIVGADWWPTEKIRLGLNLFTIDADLGSSTSGVSSAIADAIILGVTQEDIEGVTARAQFYF